MNDKLRHRHQHAPHGFLPNWVLVAFAAGSVVVVTVAQTLL